MRVRHQTPEQTAEQKREDVRVGWTRAMHLLRTQDMTECRDGRASKRPRTKAQFRKGFGLLTEMKTGCIAANKTMILYYQTYCIVRVQHCINVYALADYI